MSTQLCDWCDRPARRGLGPATGATHHLCNLHDAAPDLLAALKDAEAMLERVTREVVALNHRQLVRDIELYRLEADVAIAKAEEGS